MSDTETLYVIDAPHFYCGVIIDDEGLVIEAAFIVAYMKRKRWHMSDVRKYCRKKGWKLERVHTTTTG